MSNKLFNTQCALFEYVTSDGRKTDPEDATTLRPHMFATTDTTSLETTLTEQSFKCPIARRLNGNHRTKVTMINECEIYKHYLARAVTADGGETYLHAYDAPNFIADCETWNIAILGFDTFWIDETGILPFLDGIADFSPREKEPWAEYRSTCNRLSAEIVNQLIEEKGREKTYFSFVLLDETEYEKLP